MKRLLLIVLFLPASMQAQKVMTGYLTHWDLNMKSGVCNSGNLPYDSLRTGILNHYVMFACGVNNYGYLSASLQYDGRYVNWSGDGYNGIFYEQRAIFNSWLRMKQPTAKIDLCYFLGFAGGGGSAIVANATYRAQLVKTIDSTLSSAAAMAEYGGYDGVVLDCEPFAASDTANMRLFLHALSDMIRPKGKTIGVNYAVEFEFWSAASDYLDYYYPMLYDMSGTWAERQWHNAAVYTNGAKNATNEWGQGSINAIRESYMSATPRSKQILPIDFNGYVWQGGTLASNPADGIHDTLAIWATPPTKVQSSEIFYYNLLKNWITPNAALVKWDVGRGVPFIGIDNSGSANDYFVTFQDTMTISKVMQLADTAGLGGIFVWEIAGGYLNAANYASTSPWGSRDPFLRKIETVAKQYGWLSGTPPAVPSSPSLSLPSSGATGVSTNPTLTWNASTGATIYRVQVSVSSSFSTTVYDQSNLVGTSQVVSGLANSTVYYWRVNASNSGGTSAYSSVWGFTTAAPPPPPSAPVLASPTSGATGVSTSPTLTWNASTGATAYRVQVSVSSSFSTTVYDQSNLVGTSQAMSGLVYSMLYYWRVNASNGGGTSAYSSVWNFTTAAPPPPPSAPVLVIPASGATGVLTSPTLTWNASTGATAYQVQVSTVADFSSMTINQSVTASPYAASGLASNTLYYWRVNASNGGGTSAYSSVWSFTTVTIPAGLVAAYAFDEGSGTTVTDASGHGLTGTIVGATWTTSGKYGNALSFDGSSSYVDLGNPTALQLTGSMTLSAWVKAAANPADDGQIIAKSDNTSGWQLKTSPDTGPHTFGVGVSPSSTSLIQRYSTTVRSLSTWYHVAGVYNATTKTLDIYVNGVLDNGSLTGTVPAAQFNASVNANIGRRTGGFYFNGIIDEVQIYNRALTQAEIQTAMTTPLGALTSPPQAPVLTSPVNGATNVPVLPNLSWTALAGGVTYRLQVSTNTAFSSTAYDQTSLVGTTQTISGLAGSTQYYWRANATNTGGTGSWSQVWSFTTAALLDSTTSHMVVLRQGWNMTSSFVVPKQPAFDSVFGKISSKVGIIKDGSGKVYLPSLGINALGFWISSQGYQVYMNLADTVTFRGTALRPEQNSISLLQGWNLVSYLHNDLMVADSALGSIASLLTVAKNIAGEVYMPSYGINTIGTMKPGQGYALYVQAPGTLTYPANTNSTPPTVLSKKQSAALASVVYNTEHFNVAFKETGTSGTLLVKGISLKDGDEIAVTTNDGMIIGASAVKNGLAPITVWGDDARTDIIEGARDGDHLRLIIWSREHQRNIQLEIRSAKDGLTGETQENSLVYRKDCLSIVEALALEVSQPSHISVAFSLGQNYPNPFNPSTIIRYSLPLDVHVRLEVFDVFGRPVTVLVSEIQKAGQHQVSFTSNGLASGVYFYRLQAGTFTATHTFVLLK